MIEMYCNTCRKLLRIPSEYAGVIGRCNGCGEPVQVPGLPRLDGPAQPPALSSSDIDTPAAIPPAEPYTRDESIAIDVAVSQREMARAHKDMADSLRKQVMLSRATCGCLLLVLTAPIWIAIIAFVSTVGFTAAIAAVATFFGMVRPVAVTPDPLPVVIVNEEPPPVIEDPVPVDLPTTKAVYVEGDVYHLDRSCTAILRTASVNTLGVARERGKRPCMICAPEEPVNPILPVPSPTPSNYQPEPTLNEKVVASEQALPPPVEKVTIDQVSAFYHRPNCEDLRGLKRELSIPGALAKGLRDCPKCKPGK